MNAKRNMIYGILNKIIILFLPFVVRTVMIKVLGAEYLGLNSLFSSILQVLNLAELGFSSAIVYSMYKPIAENDVDTICALLNLYKKIYRIIGIIILIAGLLILPFLEYLINGNVPSDVNIYIIFILYLVNTVVSYLLFGYKSSLPNAFQRVDIINNVYSISQILSSLAQIILLILIKNYYIYIIILPITSIVNNVMVSIIVDKKYPEYCCRGEVSQTIKKDIKVKVAGLMINKICQTTRNALDSICASMFLGLVATAMYNNYFYIITALNSFFSIISSSIIAGIGNSIVVDTTEKNYNDMKKINFIYMWISGWSAITLLILYQPFMELWVGKELMLPFSAVFLFTLYYYILKMGDIRAVYSDAAGLWWENRYRAIIESVANVVLNVLLARIWGVQGIIAATIISLFVINFGFGSQIVFNHYFKNGKIWRYYGDHFKYLAVTMLIGAITYEICSKITGNLIQILILKGLLCIIIPNILYILIYCRTKDFNDSMSWLITRIKKN